MSRYDLPDPTCNHKASAFMSYPPILSDEFGGPGPLASTHVCGREECVADAAAWVRAKTGRAGTLTTFAERDAARAA